MGVRTFAGLLVIAVWVISSLLFPAGAFSDSNTVLAKIGETVITQRDLDEMISRMVQMRQGKTLNEAEKKMALENLVRGALIAKEAEKEKLDQSPEVKSKLMVYRNDLLIQEYLKVRIQPAINVTDADLEEMMKQNPNLIPKETLALQEILVKSEKEAQEVYQALKKGEDFSSLAVKKSVASSKAQGGNRKGTVSRGQLPPALEEAAFSLKKDEFSKPVKTDEGYYILRLVERKERSPEEMNRLQGIVKEKLRQIEINRRTQDAITNKADDLKKAMKAEVYYDRIQ